MHLEVAFTFARFSLTANVSQGPLDVFFYKSRHFGVVVIKKEAFGSHSITLANLCATKSW